MTTIELHKLVCKDVVTDVGRVGDREFLVTSFSYPAGDLVTLYLASDRNHEPVVSDRGMTHYFLATNGVELTDDREDFVQSICVMYGVDFDGQSLSKRLSPDRAGRDVLELCEAITRISALHYDRRYARYSQFAAEIETLVTGVVQPQRPVDRNWTDPGVDAERTHLVDYHFNSTRGPVVNMYVIASVRRAEVATGTIHFWETRRPARSLCVIAPDLYLPKKTAKRLSIAADNKLAIGIEGNERKIAQFALSGEWYDAFGRPFMPPA